MPVDATLIFYVIGDILKLVRATIIANAIQASITMQASDTPKIAAPSILNRMVSRYSNFQQPRAGIRYKN